MPSKNSLARVQRERKAPLAPVLQDNKPFSEKIERVKKGFYVEKDRAAKWDLLVAQMKNAKVKKTSTQLLDEAMDYMFEKYLKQ